MKQYFNLLNKKINETVIQSRKEMLENKRNKYSSIIILNFHHRDIIESFIINK